MFPTPVKSIKAIFGGHYVCDLPGLKQTKYSVAVALPERAAEISHFLRKMAMEEGQETEENGKEEREGRKEEQVLKGGPRWCLDCCQQEYSCYSFAKK